MSILNYLRNIGSPLVEKAKTFYGYQFINNERFSLSWKTKDYLDSYKTSVFVYACAKKRAEKVGGIEFVLNRASGDRVEKNEWLDLLYRPNKLQSKNEFFETYQLFKDLSGSTFIWVERAGNKVIGLHNLRPDWVTIKTSKADGSIVAYEYRVNANVLTFQPQDIIASHYSNPVNPLMGQSLIEACALSIYTERQLSEYQANVLKNGGKIEGILTHKVENITEDQIKSIQAQFKKQYSEAKNSGKPLVLYGGMEYQNLGLTPTELSYLDSKKINQLDILTVFGVPKALLGIEEIGALGGNGYESALNLFLNETIKPLMDNLCQKLNEFLIPKEFELIYEDPSPVSIDNNIKMVESGIKSYYMTPNEAREIMGLDPIAGMDSILLPFNLMPLGSEPEDKEPEETPEKGVKKKSVKHPLQDVEIRAKYWKQSYQLRTKTERKFRSLVKSYLIGQKKRVVSRLGGKKGIIADIFNFNEENKLGVEMLLPKLTEILKENGQEAIYLIGEKSSFRITSEIKRNLEKRAEYFVNEINQTSFKQLEKVFEDNLAGNSTRDELVEQITNLYDDKITEGRVNAIAQTETGIAMNSGRNEGYRQVGITIKIWVHRPFAKEPREEHMAMDGEEVNIDEPFSNGLMYPCDPDGDASEVINCHCVI